MAVDYLFRAFRDDGMQIMFEIRDIFWKPRARRNVCRGRVSLWWVETATIAVVLTFGAMIFGGPPLLVYGLALYIIPSGYGPELILVGGIAVWGVGLFLLVARR